MTNPNDGVKRFRALVIDDVGSSIEFMAIVATDHDAAMHKLSGILSERNRELAAARLVIEKLREQRNELDVSGTSEARYEAEIEAIERGEP